MVSGVTALGPTEGKARGRMLKEQTEALEFDRSFRSIRKEELSQVTGTLNSPWGSADLTGLGTCHQPPADTTVPATSTLSYSLAQHQCVLQTACCRQVLTNQPLALI